MNAENPAHRELCLRCLRPARTCYCAHVPTLPSATRVVFLQHVRERRMPIGTARMAHLALPNSELHVGVDFEHDERLRALAEDPGAAILFPSAGAQDASELPPGSVKTLVVVDGTWPLAKKLIRVNPALQRLRRVGLRPSRPGNYRIRKEPADHCLATIEAVAEVLGVLEKDPERFRALLRPFEAMVDGQLQFARERKGPGRHARPPGGRPPVHVRIARELAELEGRLVLVHGESNARAVEGSHSREHELVHLEASRLATGERFSAVLRPAWALDPSTSHHLELPEARLLEGEDRAGALERWGRFLRPGELLCGWGYFAHSLLGPHARGAGFVDLREHAVRILRRRPGGMEQAVALLGAEVPSTTGQGRAHRRVEQLCALVGALRRPSV